MKFLLLFCVPFAIATANEDIACTCKEAHGDISAVLIPHVKGILLVGNHVRWSKEHFEGVQIEDLDVPGGPSRLEKRLESRFLNQPMTKSGLEDLEKEIVYYYRDQNRPVVHVQIPEQDVTDGILQVVVYESKLGKVETEGNRYFKSGALEKEIRLKPGEPINIAALTKDLQWLNRNPFRQSDALFEPGSTKGSTDVILVTQDRWPYRFYAGVDNTGLDDTGWQRWFTGVNFGNLWGCGHLFNFQFTTGTRYNEFYAYSGQYIAPLPWLHHTFYVYGGYSGVRAVLLVPNNPGFTTHGASMQVSPRYEIPLWPAKDFLEEMTIGFDFKRTNNNLSFTGVPFFGQSVNITQIMLGYNSGFELFNFKFNATLESFYSPGQIVGDQTNADFNSLRQGAKNKYWYGRCSILPIYRFSPAGFMIQSQFRGQYSSANLLSSEQFGVGGYDTVRGYNERELNGDSAVVVNIELRTPEFPVFRKNKKTHRDALQLLAFYDYGKVWEHSTTQGEIKSEFIDSIGPGLRYYLDPYIQFRIDYGFAFRKVESLPPENQPHQRKWHFSFIASY